MKSSLILVVTLTAFSANAFAQSANYAGSTRSSAEAERRARAQQAIWHAQSKNRRTQATPTKKQSKAQLRFSQPADTTDQSPQRSTSTSTT